MLTHGPQDGATENLQRPQRGHEPHRVGGHRRGRVPPPAGALIDVLRDSGFEIERLIELYASEGAETHEYYDYVTPDWARKWPAEEIWVARKRS